MSTLKATENTVSLNKVLIVAILIVIVVIGAYAAAHIRIVSSAKITTITATTTLSAVTVTVNNGSLSAVTTTSIIITTTTNNGRQSGFAGQPCFSPGGNCDQVLIQYINGAQRSIHIVIYTFTLHNVEQALVAAHNRGVDVELVCDQHEWSVQGGQCPVALQDGLSVKKSTNSYLTHDKFMIVDEVYILTGSYNYSNAGTCCNDENLIVLFNPSWAGLYEQRFQAIYQAGT